MWLAGIPVADKAVLHLAASLRDAELIHTAERLERAYAAKPGSSPRHSRPRGDPPRARGLPVELAELRATLLQEHVWRRREGL